MRSTCCDLRDAGEERRRACPYLRRLVDIARRIVADLPVRALAPTPRGPIVLRRAAVIVAGRDVDDTGQEGDLDRKQSLVDGVVAELAARVSAPTPHRRICLARACVGLA